LKADPPTAFKTEQQARRTAGRLATTKAGVIVLAKRGDPETGDYDEQPNVIFKSGRVPPKLDL
jgi:hypothetical protein